MTSLRSAIILILVSVAVGAWEQEQTYPNEISDPCVGRTSGFARDLRSCRHYFWCENGVGYRGTCSNNNLFDGETETCVTPESNPCFKCRDTEPYYLNSVPSACQQYIQCFNRQSTLHICPSGLVFDGRARINQCNTPPPTGGCYRESDEPENGDPSVTCPPVTDKPVHIPHPDSCSIFFVCSGLAYAERHECPSGLHFNLGLGVCDLPENAGCQQSPPTESTPPPSQSGPVLPCEKIGEFIPDRTRCTVYHLCTAIPNGYSERRCGDRLIFDYITRQCTLPSSGKCWATSHS